MLSRTYEPSQTSPPADPQPSSGVHFTIADRPSSVHSTEHVTTVHVATPVLFAPTPKVLSSSQFLTMGTTSLAVGSVVLLGMLAGLAGADEWLVGIFQPRDAAGEKKQRGKQRGESSSLYRLPDLQGGPESAPLGLGTAQPHRGKEAELLAQQRASHASAARIWAAASQEERRNFVIVQPPRKGDGTAQNEWILEKNTPFTAKADLVTSAAVKNDSGL
eukprot:gene19097-22832_t